MDLWGKSLKTIWFPKQLFALWCKSLKTFDFLIKTVALLSKSSDFLNNYYIFEANHWTPLTLLSEIICPAKCFNFLNRGFIFEPQHWTYLHCPNNRKCCVEQNIRPQTIISLLNHGSGLHKHFWLDMLRNDGSCEAQHWKAADVYIGGRALSCKELTFFGTRRFYEVWL